MNENNENEIELEKKHNKIIDFVDNLSSDSKRKADKKNDIDIIEKNKTNKLDNELEFVKNVKSFDKDKKINGRIYNFSKSKEKKESKKKIFSILIILIILISVIIIIIPKGVSDSDGDGIPDEKDLFPNKNAKIKFSVINFTYLKYNRLTNYTNFFYKISELKNFDWGNFTYDYKIDNVTLFNYSKINNNTFLFKDTIIDVADNIASHTINIQFYMLENEITTFLDIDDDETGGLTIEYDLISGKWTGDDNSGVSNGSYDDGIITNTDCKLEYNFTTV